MRQKEGQQAYFLGFPTGKQSVWLKIKIIILKYNYTEADLLMLFPVNFFKKTSKTPRWVINKLIIILLLIISFICK